MHSVSSTSSLHCKESQQRYGKLDKISVFVPVREKFSFVGVVSTIIGLPAAVKIRRLRSKTEMEKSKTGWQRFKQQELSHCQPIYTPKTISPTFFLFGIILIPVGVTVYILSKNIEEIKLDYTNCTNTNEQDQPCGTFIAENINGTCTCSIPFNITSAMQGTVLLYYHLTNFHQNHRAYVESRDDNQLLGDIGTAENPIRPSSDCDPLSEDPNGKFYFPCGGIANSMFSDNITLYYYGESGQEEKIKVDLIRTGIAWESDKKHKFKNPEQGKDDPIWGSVFNPQPRNWKKSIWELDQDNPANNGVENEDFIIWMRVAALPDFRKLYRKINSLGTTDGLPAGQYVLDVEYNFEVISFGGTKSFIFTQSAFFGGRNLILGIMSMTAGSVILFLGIVCLVLTVKRKKSWSRQSNVRPSVVRDYGTHTTRTSRRVTKSM